MQKLIAKIGQNKMFIQEPYLINYLQYYTKFTGVLIIFLKGNSQVHFYFIFTE